MIDHSKWVKNLTETQLMYCLNELRERGMAIAVYDVGAITECFGVEETDAMRQWMDDNRDELEEAMCETARQIIRDNCPGIDAEP